MILTGNCLTNEHLSDESTHLIVDFIPEGRWIFYNQNLEPTAVIDYQPSISDKD